MFEKYLELGVKVRVMSYCVCYISGVMKVYRYIYCNRRERLVVGLGIWYESFFVRSFVIELFRIWVVYSRVGDGVKIYILLYINWDIVIDCLFELLKKSKCLGIYCGSVWDYRYL